MKKVFAGVLVSIQLLTTVAFANFTIDMNNAEGNTKYTVTADSTAGEIVTMLVAKKGEEPAPSDIIAVQEGKSDKETIEFKFEFDDETPEGEYTVYVMNNGTNTKLLKSFAYARKAQIETASGYFATNANTPSDLESILNPADATYGSYKNAFKAMGIDYDTYNSCNADQKTVIGNMFTSEKATSSDLVGLLNECIAIVKIQAASSDSDIENALICAMPKFNNVPFEEESEEKREWIVDLMRGTSYSSTDAFLAKYNEICMLYEFNYTTVDDNHSRFSEFSDLFNNYAGALGITTALYPDYGKYLALSAANRIKVGDTLVNLLVANKAKTVPQLMNTLSQAYNTTDFSQGKTEGNASGTGAIISGGGGGGGTSNPSLPTTPQKPISKKYTDMGEALWAETAVNTLTEKGIIAGDGNGTFRPNDAITRAEFTKMLISAIGAADENAVAEFSDLDSSQWYYKYIASAYAAGIVYGMSETEFGIGRTITRQEMAVMLARTLAIYKEMPETRGNADFSDSNEIADWAKDDVMKLYRTGLMSGMGDGKFKPGSSATRAQAAMVIYNLLK